MPDKVVDIPGLGAVAFPDSMSEEEIATQAAKLYQRPPTSTPTPSLSQRAYEFGSKTLPEAIQGIGHAATALLPTLGGVAGAAVGCGVHGVSVRWRSRRGAAAGAAAGAA